MTVRDRVFHQVSKLPQQGKTLLFEPREERAGSGDTGHASAASSPGEGSEDHRGSRVLILETGVTADPIPAALAGSPRKVLTEPRIYRDKAQRPLASQRGPSCRGLSFCSIVSFLPAASAF